MYLFNMSNITTHPGYGERGVDDFGSVSTALTSFSVLLRTGIDARGGTGGFRLGNLHTQ